MSSYVFTYTHVINSNVSLLQLTPSPLTHSHTHTHTHTHTLTHSLTHSHTHTHTHTQEVIEVGVLYFDVVILSVHRQASTTQLYPPSTSFKGIYHPTGSTHACNIPILPFKPLRGPIRLLTDHPMYSTDCTRPLDGTFKVQITVKD